jgi:hypothetical protein
MSKEYRSPGAGEGGGTQIEARRNSRGPTRWASAALALLVLVLQTACATGYPMGSGMMGSRYRYRPLTPPESPDAKKRAAQTQAAAAAKADTTAEVPATSGTDAGNLGGPVLPRSVDGRKRPGNGPTG